VFDILAKAVERCENLIELVVSFGTMKSESNVESRVWRGFGLALAETCRVWLEPDWF
jgi:hypothetical protein